MFLGSLWHVSGRLIVVAAVVVALHSLTNGQYGFHRDELAFVDDARRLAWGYVAYPPVTPAIARLAFAIFGNSLAGLRFFAALAQGAAIVLTGLMTRELGGKRAAQMVAAVAVAIAPVSVVCGELFQYVTFDYLWWVAIAWMMIRLLKSDDPRWWVGIGAFVGLGMMTKYTMGVLVIAMAAGVVLTSSSPARRHLRTGWLWAGVALSIAIFLPNAWWQIQHHLVSLDFLREIHARDVRLGRTSGFLLNQLFIPAAFVTIPLWVAGLWFFFFGEEGRRYRTIGWMFVFIFAILLAAKGREYYMGPAYPMLLAAGAVMWERWRPVARGFMCASLALGCVVAPLLMPIAPINSYLWSHATDKLVSDFREEVGWPELVDTIAGIHASLPADTAILAGNYGEAGAIDLYGPAHGLPSAISGVNSYWLRGYGDPPPQTLIVVGLRHDFLDRNFRSCELAGHVTNRYGVRNEETTDHPDIYVCRGLLRAWPEFWKDFQYFG